MPAAGRVALVLGWAPVRAAALESWILFGGRIRAARRVLLERLSDLESMADSYAIARGCSRAALADALLKSDASAVGVAAFSYGAERRIVALVDGPTAASVRHHLPGPMANRGQDRDGHGEAHVVPPSSER